MVQVTNDFLDHTKKLTLFSIQCRNGKRIKNHSEFPNEDEIVLPPGTYLKVKSSISTTHNLCIVYLEEVSPTPAEIAQLTLDVAACSSMLIPSRVAKTNVLWLDPYLNTSENNRKTRKTLEKLFPKHFLPCEQLDEAVHHIEEKQDEHFLLITGGQVGRQAVPKVNHLQQLHFIVVYCLNKQANEQWSKEYEKVKTIRTVEQKNIVQLVYLKVKAVIVEEDELIKTVQELYQDLSGSQAVSPTFSDLIDEPENMSTLIHRIMDQPLVSLTESLRDTAMLISSLEKRIQGALAKSKNPVDGLTTNESAAICMYTMNCEPYQATLSRLLNKDLRSESRHGLKKWSPYLKLLLHALNKLPSYAGTVYRGLPINIGEQFEVGQTGTWWSISTGTSNISILELPEFLGKSGLRTLFIIECKNGKYIRKHSYFEADEEVLLLPGFNFEVISRFYGGNGLHIIGLREVAFISEEAPPLPTDAVIMTQICNVEYVNNVHIVWLDPNIHKSKENKDTQEKLRDLFHEYFTAVEQFNEAMQYMEERHNQRFVLITSGSVGRQCVPKLTGLPQLHSIVVYCMNRQANEQWSRNYEKVQLIVAYYHTKHQ